VSVPLDADPAVQYRFGSFVLSPPRRVLLQDGVEVRLIPRYFDLLRLLIERRDEAVHRQEIFDRVWTDVIVSDAALSQAIRTLRRALGDDAREPSFIRTVSRYGYQFVYRDVTVEPAGSLSRALGTAEQIPADDGTLTPETTGLPPDDRLLAAGLDALEPLILRLVDPLATDEERRDAAEQLHALGTAEALRRLESQPERGRARAILRDARWDVPGAGDVPLGSGGDWLRSIAAIIWLRLNRARRLAARRWFAAAMGGAVAGTIGGAVGGLALLLLPASLAPAGVVIALALVGALAGTVGGAGVGAGLAAAEALARSQRAIALVACGGVGGALAGSLAHAITRMVLTTMFGRDLPSLGGGPEGLAIGVAAGLGYALATARVHGGGMATPHGAERIRTAIVAGGACAAAGLLLALADRHLVAASLDAMAERFAGSSVGLTPIARALGEGDLRPMTRTAASAFEGFLFGSGVVLGLTRRSVPRR
jgi:DNA-binding winged helix-turn-helix (wHTH) protein